MGNVWLKINFLLGVSRNVMRQLNLTHEKELCFFFRVFFFLKKVLRS